MNDFFDDLSEARKIFMVLFGAPGVGKTVLSQRLAGKSVILTDEAGYRALFDWPEFEGKFLPRTYRGIKDVDTILKLKREGKIDADTLIFDTFTGIRKIEERVRMDPNYPGYLNTNRNHPEVPVLQDYLLSEKLWTPVMQKLAAQDDFNVILNCHVRLPDAEKKIPGDKVRPDLPNAVYQLVNGKANLVVYMDMMGGEEAPGSKQVGLGRRTPIQRFVSTVATNKVAGKSQIKSLQPFMSDDEFVKGVKEWLQSR